MNNSAKGAPVRLAKTDFPVWHFPLPRPHTGPMLGNSSTGLMVWGEGAVLEHPETCAGTVLALVEAHAAGAEQSDYRTQLLLRWRGRA